MDDYVASASTALLAQAQELARHFHQRCEAAALPSFEALADPAPFIESLTRQAQCADLLVMSQPDPSLPAHRQRLAELEEVLLASARPVLLIVLRHWRSEADDGRPQQRLAQLRQWLALQGVEAEARDEVTALAIGDALLNAASDHGADLAVMGAYGHSRWAERLFGGVSRTLLQSMTVPVLMSH